MKNRFIKAIIIAAVALASSVASYAQPNSDHHEDWKKKMMSEKRLSGQRTEKKFRETYVFRG